MTEKEWRASTDPRKMIDYLNGRVSERKLRLFSCACCRRIWQLLTDERSRRAVEVAELMADGSIAREIIEPVATAATTASYENPVLAAPAYAIVDTSLVPSYEPAGYAFGVAQAVVQALQQQVPWSQQTAVWNVERREQVKILKDIFGDIYRVAATDPRWFTSTALDLASAIYESRDFGPMPILADALEEAGCDAADVLAHCRGGGPHVRGCWVVDLILGKS